MKINSRSEVTLTGYAGTLPQPRDVTGANLATFRMSVRPTPNVIEWYSVTLWRGLANAGVRHITKGTPLKIIGHLRQVMLPAKGQYPARLIIDVTAAKIGIFETPEDVRWLKQEGGETAPPAGIPTL